MSGSASVPSAVLRAYRPSDLETLYRIDQACFPRGIAYGHDELQAYVGSAGSRAELAEISGQVVGFILSQCSAKRGHIITIDVLEAHRRGGIGSLLLETAERHASSLGVTRMCLETATTNKPAIAFWNKHGYRQLEIVRNYYGRGLDAFAMCKRLDDASSGGST